MVFSHLFPSFSVKKKKSGKSVKEGENKPLRGSTSIWELLLNGFPKMNSLLLNLRILRNHQLTSRPLKKNLVRWVTSGFGSPWFCNYFFLLWPLPNTCRHTTACRFLRKSFTKHSFHLKNEYKLQHKKIEASICECDKAVLEIISKRKYVLL